MSKGEKTRQAILDYAVGLASQVGLEGLTIGGLAKDLNLSKSGLFAHFQSKEVLQIQVLSWAEERFVEKVVRPVLGHPAGESRIRALFEYWSKWGLSNTSYLGGCIFLAATVELDDKPGPVRDHLVTLQKEWIESIKRISKSAVEAGFFKEETDHASFAQQLWGIFLSLNFYSRLLKDPQAQSRSRQAFENLILKFRSVKRIKK